MLSILANKGNAKQNNTEIPFHLTSGRVVITEKITGNVG
jgi:hypothetical protein